MSKFKPGDRVFLFNAMGPAVESDEVFAVLHVCRGVEGKEQDGTQGIAENLKAGNLVVKEEYQLCKHGIQGAEVLFGSEAECREWFRNWFNE